MESVYWRRYPLSKNHPEPTLNPRPIFTQYLKLALACLALFLSSSFLQAQDCQLILDQAKQQYNQGHFMEALTAIQNCSTEGAAPQIKWQAARLQALCYLALKETEKAREAGIRMLELNPRYQPNNLDDPSELIRLLESIPVISRFGIGIQFSPMSNFSLPEIRDVYTLNSMSKTYTGKNGYLIGIRGNYNFNQHWGMYLSLNALQKKYKLDYRFEQWTFQMEEKSTYLNIPLGVNYTFNPGKKLRFYGSLAGYSSYLLQGESSFSANNPEYQKDYSIQNVNSQTRRNAWDFGIGAGAGIIYAQRNGQLSFEINYLRSFRNINNPDTRYEFTRLMGDYYYLDDDIRLHSLTLQLGYVQYLNFRIIR